MDQKIYYVVEVEISAVVFDNIKDASYFMREAAEHIIFGRYQSYRPNVRMAAYTYEQLCNTFPKNFKKEDDADETTASTDADQSAE